MQIFHSNTCCSIARISENELLAQCVVLSTNQEAAAWISAGVDSFIIKDAGWARYRSPEGAVPYTELPELSGIEAYLKAGPEIKKALAGKVPEVARELLNECVRGIVQAETFLIKERGFSDEAAYTEFWDVMYINSCYHFSHLAEREVLWMDYVGYSERSFNLFNRVHNVTIHQEKDNSYYIPATFIDSFHELGIRLWVAGDGLITKAEADFTRCPDITCTRITNNIKKLIGMKLPGQSKKDLAALVGGPQGCSHMADIVFSASQALGNIRLSK